MAIKPIAIGTSTGGNSDVSVEDSNGSLVFRPNGTEQMRIDTTGALTLGTALAIAEGGTGVTSLSSLDAADLGSGSATDGYVLTADGAGGTAWEAASGGGGGTAPGRNLIINGDFRINQRGAASRTATTNAYNYDRWYYDVTYLYQVIEDLNVVNSDYTISWSGSGLTAGWVISSNTTSSIPASFNNVTSGSSFTVSGKTTGDHLWIRFGGTLTNLADVQVEAGTVATPFERRLIGTELALCQRYYQRFPAYTVFSFFAQGPAYGTTYARVGVPAKSVMRAIPTLGQSAASTFYLEGGSASAVSSIAPYGTLSPNHFIWQVNTSGSISGSVWLYANNTLTAYLEASAEL